MKEYKLLVDKSVAGYTSGSLQRLRNELARRVDHALAVYQINIGKLLAGFLIFDLDAREAIWSGEGFRRDGGGEGGAGLRTALGLLAIFGIVAVPLDIELSDRYFQDELEQALVTIIESYGDESYAPEGEEPLKVSQYRPGYLRQEGR